jgi:hypothetical protein
MIILNKKSLYSAQLVNYHKEWHINAFYFKETEIHDCYSVEANKLNKILRKMRNKKGWS